MKSFWYVIRALGDWVIKINVLPFNGYAMLITTPSPSKATFLHFINLGDNNSRTFGTQSLQTR